MVSASKIKKICSLYELGEYLSIQKIDKEGILNHNYILTTEEGRYFVKEVREKTKSKLSYIFAVESFMREKGIPAVVMLRTLSKESFFEKSGSIFTVYRFINNKRIPFLKSEDYRRIGELLGRIHKLSEGTIPQRISKRKFKRPSKAVIKKRLRAYKNVIKEKKIQNTADKKFLNYIDLKLEKIHMLKNETRLPNDMIIHGDFHKGNLLFDQKARKIIGVCDWEKAEVGPRA